MIKISQSGDFSKTYSFLKRVRKIDLNKLEKYGQMGVNALRDATPIDTGATANSWYYEIKRSKNSFSIIFGNSNIENGVPIAIILEHGHGTRNGGWVEGRNYIEPAIQPIFDAMANEAWKEVTG